MVDVAPVQVEPRVDQFSRLAIGNDGTIYVVWQRCIEGGEPNLDCGGTKAKILLSKSNRWWKHLVKASAGRDCNACSRQLPLRLLWQPAQYQRAGL